MRLPSLLKKENVIAGMLISIILLLSLTPDVIKWLKTPYGHLYVPIHNNLYDYALYTNYIQQGLAGQSVLFDRFTTEEHQGKLVNPFYLMVGRLWRITGVTNPHTVYFIMRILLGLAWALLLYWYIRRSIPSKTGRIFALFFVLYSASFPLISWSEKGLSISWAMTWWSELDPTVRATFLPAHLAGHILLLLTVIFFTSNATISKMRFWKLFSFIPGTITGFIAGLFHTPSLILPLMLLPVWTVVVRQWKRLVLLVVCLPLSAVSFFILSKQFTQSPWILGWSHEKLSFAISFPEYLVALGPVLPLAFLGVFMGKSSWRLRLLWILWIGIGLMALFSSPFLFQGAVPLLHSFPVSNVRFLQIAIIVPLSLLAGDGLGGLQRKVKSFLFFSVCILLFITTFIGYPQALTSQITNQFGGPLMQYPTKTWMEAVKSLRKGDQRNAVLSMPFAGLYIAMNTQRTVYVGRYTSTIDMEKKTDWAWDIFETTMPVCDAYALLSDNRISEIFFGYDEKLAGGDLTRYPFVKLKQDFGDTQIYEFTVEKPAQCGNI